MAARAEKSQGYTRGIAQEEKRLKLRRWTLDDTAISVKDPVLQNKINTIYDAINSLEAQSTRGTWVSQLEDNLNGNLKKRYDDMPDTNTEKGNVSFSECGSQTARIVNEGRYAAYLLGFGQDYLAAIGCNHVGVIEELPERNFLHKHGCTPAAFDQGGIKQAHEFQKLKPWLMSDKIGLMAMRTSWCDDYLERFAQDHAGQTPNFVILGGGWDFRLLRVTSLREAGGKLFEVDAPGTQKLKLEALEKVIESGIYEVCNRKNRDAITYVNCDFANESWFDKLVKAGMDASKPTAILMEGITYYIPEEAIRANLEIVSNKFPNAPATIAFDYPNPEIREFMQKAMKKIGEPWLFASTSDNMENIVEECDLRVIENLSPASLLDVYVPRRKSDGLPISPAGDVKAFLVAGNKNVNF